MTRASLGGALETASGRVRPFGRWIGAGTSILALALWLSQLQAHWLALAAAGAAVWATSAVRRRGRLSGLAAMALVAAVVTAAGAQLRLWRVAQQWPALQNRVEERAADQLREALNDLVDRGERAVGAAAAVASEGRLSDRARFDQLDRARAEHDVAALVLLDRAGRSRVWSGEHRGALPAGVGQGSGPYLFHDGPLASRLYFSRPLRDGGVAVASVLLESDLGPEGARPFAERFAAETGVVPRFSLPDRAGGESVWDWSTDRPILSVSFEELTQENWWRRVERQGRLWVGGAWLLALLLLLVGWYRDGAGPPTIPVATLTLALMLAPVGELAGVGALFAPAYFVLPLPWDIPLGRLLLLLSGAAIWALVHTYRRDPRLRLPLWVQCLLGGAVIAGGLELVRHSASVALRAERAGGGLALQVATVLLLAIPLYLAAWLGTRAPARRGRAVGAIAAGFATAAAAAALLAAAWDPQQPIPWWAALGWTLPLAAVWYGQARLGNRGSALLRWAIASGFAVIVALPTLWVQHVHAKLRTAEIQLSRLGTESDPFLDFLLRNFAERARFFHERREEGVDLLYHSWVASGLAREGYEARLTTWVDGRPAAELRLSDVQQLPAEVLEAVSESRRTDREVLARYTEIEDLHYLLVVPLPGDRSVSVAVPPRRRLGRATALARFLEQEEAHGVGDPVESLFLVPHPGGQGSAAADSVQPVSWSRTEAGWRSEARAHFPSGWMHAHLFIRTGSPALLTIRAVLVASLLFLLMIGLWGSARAICGPIPRPSAVAPGWIRSVRGRLTVALFAFFLLPTALFAAVAYQAVSREVVRSAANIALRALDLTVTNVARVPMPRLGEEVGVDLLMYRDGTIADAAATEAMALGLFQTWLPPEVHLAFRDGEDLEEWQIRRLGANQHVIGYRRFSPSTVFAAPIPLASDEIARRQAEFRDIALVLALVGAGLSVFLSLLVGRALTRPIDELSRAATAIGSGDLRVRLVDTREDEFRPVYRSFNRMANGLRRARAALERETRRTETIVAEAATGVLALDSEGRVELVNPRAEQILGTALERGVRLPRSNPMLEAVADAIAELRSDGPAELSRELELEARIVRLRARSLRPSGGPRGSVVALEDVTAEIRSARVLAWGEMARQVAHEIKNPLTPIKLAVQHLRRAHADRRADFDVILDRNVDAVLHEIDRLGEIARAFARFGTPAGAEAGALEPVQVARAVSETLAIYRGAGGELRYDFDPDGAASAVAVARVGELKEVLVNLLENAREAIDGPGEVRVTVRADVDPDWVEVVVADTGEGIDPEMLPRIFEPHFSTRSSGTGLGLAIVRRMVESWGGAVDAESRPGGGTRMRLRLRAADGERGTPLASP